MFGINFFNEMPRPFKTQYRCYSVSMLPGSERDDLEKGGKIIMPPSALDQLTRLNIVYPMLFKLTNQAVSLDFLDLDPMDLYSILYRSMLDPHI